MHLPFGHDLSVWDLLISHDPTIWQFLAYCTIGLIVLIWAFKPWE